MFKSVLFKNIIPFIFWYFSFIGLAIIVDLILHLLDLKWIGRSLGYIGTIVLILSFVYSLRKRKIIEYATPKTFLEIHEYLAWIGSVLLVIHAGTHFNAIIPWLATLTLIIVVAFGIIGKFVLKEANSTLSDLKKDLQSKGLDKVEIQKKLFFDSIMVENMKKWRAVHLPISFIFLILSLIHIISILLFSV